MKKPMENKLLGSNTKLVITIIPIVVAMILVFLAMTRSSILSLSEDKMALETQNCAEDINVWTEQTLSELNIYKNLIEKNCTTDEETLEVYRASFNLNDAYPLGLYGGDESGVYLDGSDWVPDKDFIVTERNWYKEGVNHTQPAFGEPYVDAQTGKICLSASSLINYKPEKAVMAADIYVNYTSSIVKNASSGIIENAFIVSGESGFVISDGNEKENVKSLNDDTTPLLYSNINDLIQKNGSGAYKTTGADGKYYVYIRKLQTNDWYLVTYMNQKIVLGGMHRLEISMIIIGAVCSLILILLTKGIAKEMSAIRKKANTDPLTKLFNRNIFRELVMESLEASPNQGILLMIDMDNFKLVNDQLGHPEGDKVLKCFAHMLENYFNRNKDIVARIGGDEFAVYVGRSIECPETEAMLNKFIALFHNTFDELYPKQKLSVSIGGSYVKSCGSVYEKLYQNADNAMYQIKKNGKNGFTIL